MKIVSFLLQDGPNALKHKQWTHPLLACCLHYITTSTVIIGIHDWFFSSFYTYQSSRNHPKTNDSISLFFLLYFIFLLLYRILINFNDPITQKKCIYENMWLCNTTLLMGAYGLYTNRTIIVMGHVIAVSIDQVLWYVDLTGWALSSFRKFPIGVAKYITWPESTWLTRITCTHHLWTIPLLTYGVGGIHPVALPLSWIIVILNVISCRLMTPFQIQGKMKGQKGQVNKYLNVNLAFELWKDVTFESLQIQRDQPSAPLYLWRLIWRWQLFNSIIFAFILFPLSGYHFGHMIL